MTALAEWIHPDILVINRSRFCSCLQETWFNLRFCYFTSSWFQDAGFKIPDLVWTRSGSRHCMFTHVSYFPKISLCLILSFFLHLLSSIQVFVTAVRRPGRLWSSDICCCAVLLCDWRQSVLDLLYWNVTRGNRRSNNWYSANHRIWWFIPPYLAYNKQIIYIPFRHIYQTSSLSSTMSHYNVLIQSERMAIQSNISRVILHVQ